jgi:hypothetical protein
MWDYNGLDGMEPQTAEECAAFVAQVKARRQAAYDAYVTAEEASYQAKCAALVERNLLAQEGGAVPAAVVAMYDELVRVERRENALPAWMVGERRQSLMREVRE